MMPLARAAAAYRRAGAISTSGHRWARSRSAAGLSEWPSRANGETTSRAARHGAAATDLPSGRCDMTDRDRRGSRASPRGSRPWRCRGRRLGHPCRGGAAARGRRGRDPAVGRRPRLPDAGADRGRRQGQPRSRPDPLCGDRRPAGAARRRSPRHHAAVSGQAGRPDRDRRAGRRPVGAVHRLPVPARARRRGAGARADVRHLPRDGRGRRRRAGAGAAAGGARLPSRSGCPGRGGDPAHPGDPDQLAAQPDRRGDDPPRARGRGRAVPAPRSLADLRRGLCHAALRGRARRAGRPARHGRADGHGLQPLQVACDDRLAGRLADRPAGPGRARRQPRLVHALRLAALHPGRGDRGPEPGPRRDRR